jgi:hypothetical protein
MSSPHIKTMPRAARFRRSPDEVMRLARMGSFHPTRLSFMQTLLCRLEREAWIFDRPLWEIDANGVGRAVYTVHGPERSYSLVAFAHDLPDELRSDRVIASAWDATFALSDGLPDKDDLRRLAENVPQQEAGRVTARELSLSRANRSVRLFEHVVAALAEGRQSDRSQIDAVGYLMRTTAVYGSGKFGAADRTLIAATPAGPVLDEWRFLSVPVPDGISVAAAAANPVQAAKAAATGLEVSVDLWRRLDRYAHRTYAPATEDSRRSGAGVGTRDND